MIYLPSLVSLDSTPRSTSDIWYDVVISYHFNCIIVGGTFNIHVFDYITKKHLKRIEMKGMEVHELEIDKSGLNLYLTGVWDGHKRVAKFNLQKLLLSDSSSEESCLWKSDDNLLINVWGIGIFESKGETFVYAMDYGIGLIAFDSKTGKTINHILPRVTNGYGVTFTPENEMIITSASRNESPVSVYTFNDELKQWNLKKNCQRIESDNTPYGVHYEIITQRIFVVDTMSKSINAFDMNTMKKVFHYQLIGFDVYGILIDKKTGILYLPDVSGKLSCFK